ncbi:MAG: universal stress protein [Eggerthellaceae bacterium]|nr:universal stress protein [Eggerthellaceae bacterium]
MARYNKIFAALDGAATQEAVARRALSIAHDNNAEVMFGHVIDSVPYEANGIDFAALIEDGRQRIEETLSKYFTRARNDECIPSIDVQVRAGRVAETLVEGLVEPYNPDLVICGVRGLSNIKYAFVGSVSTQLIRNVKCDVLVVRPETLEEHPQDEWHD